MDEAQRLVDLIPRLRRYARALVGERAGADDLVQDTLERAWTKLHLYRRGTDLRAWLFTIMHNLHVNARIRTGRSPEIAGAPQADGGEAAPAQGGGLLLRDLERALGELPEEQRTVVLLVGLEGLSYRDAADVLGVPVGTVMSRLARGRERLRRLVDGEARQTMRQVR